MRMPETIEPAMFAPCGMNCLVCYKHCYHKKPCAGCLKSDQGKPEHCRTCKIKDCIREKELTYCYECPSYPCKQIKSLEKSYNTRYHTSLMENSKAVREQGLIAFMEQQKEACKCPNCGGIISIHDAECSECQHQVRYGENGEIPDVEALIDRLQEKDTSAAYRVLQELEWISDETDLVYRYTEKFVEMIKSEKYVIRVRGFRLLCKQAKWDKDNILDETIDTALNILKDEKPTAVRQALAALSDVVKYKPDLRDVVELAVSDINYLRYKDTMHSLIAKDIEHVLILIQNLEGENIS